MQKTLFPCLAAAAILAGCGGSDSDSSIVEPETNPTFTLGVSDAPVDDALKVVVYFDEVELIGEGDPVVFDVTGDDGSAKVIDLLTLQGSEFENIVENQEIPAGEYTQLRVKVTDESYIEMEDGIFDLSVPSNELKLDGFTASLNSNVNFTLEFDLRKSLVDPVGQPDTIFLKPRGVRLVNNLEAGTIAGTVSASLLEEGACADKVDIAEGNAVYLFEGSELDATLLGDDADTPDNADEISPYAMAAVTFDEEQQVYQYEAAFVEVGDYTVALTCRAAIDQPETDENEADGFVFLQTAEATVNASESAEINFE